MLLLVVAVVEVLMSLVVVEVLEHIEQEQLQLGHTQFLQPFKLVEEEIRTKVFRIHYLLYIKEHHHTLEHPSHHLEVVAVLLMMELLHFHHQLQVNRVCLADLEEEMLLIHQVFHQVVLLLDLHSQELLDQLQPRDGDTLEVKEVVAPSVVQVVVVPEEQVHHLQAILPVELVFNFQQHLEIQHKQ
tara:strand:+ start:648 stop:1205 length:558 start_codon:yes stop_codon:yes gene_type:complete